ncbi:MAG: right-handed parallel beta-helix repeat-containing protein [Pseudonocardiaceae bacterium]
MTQAHVGSLIAAMIGIMVVVSGCTSAEPPDAPPQGSSPPPRQIRPLPTDCTTFGADPEQARTALAQALPGDTVCLRGDRLADTELDMANSGTPSEPITVVADGALVRSLDLSADHVIVDGFSLFDGDGLTMQGRGLLARNNVIYNAAKDGIVCDGCFDTVIESNVIRRADGTGIYLTGERITVRDNTVSESVLRTQGDADGIRFFGPGHRLTENTIRDIKETGYGRGAAPHTDCFQTYNTAQDIPTFDVVIADNVCTNVDVQCLIATANEDGAHGAPPGQIAITFERNTCAVDGSQAVLLENFPHVIVRNNRFSGPGDRAVQLSRGSTDCTLIGNTVAAPMRPYEIDEQSRRGFRDEGA